MKPVLERIKEKIILPPDWESGLSDECWLWTGAMSSGDYPIPVISDGGRIVSARRLWDKGPKSQRISVVCHSRCMNPPHFKRQRHGEHLRAYSTGNGRRCRRLSAPAVMEIREIYADGVESQMSLSRLHGVSPATISKAVTGGNYTEIYGPTKKSKQYNGSHQGEKNPKAKLNAKNVLEILGLLNNKTPERKIAQKFYVSRRCISDIKHGRRWSHVTGIYWHDDESLVLKYWKGGQKAS